MGFFVRLTLMIAAAIVALIVLFAVLKIVVAAAILAAIVLAALFAVHFVRGWARSRRALATNGDRAKQPF